MQVQEGPGGPTAAEHEGFARLSSYSPTAARNVLVELSARLREQDVTMASWSKELGSLLD